MRIVKADINHISLIAPLLDQYRIFYKQNSNVNAAKEFLEKRVLNNESIVFLAIDGNKPIGFVQLYPSFSSVSLQAIFILNDLYVATSHRGKKVGEQLLTRAMEYCREKECKGLALETGIDNPAKRLYERLGWKKDTDCFHYFWTLK